MKTLRSKALVGVFLALLVLGSTILLFRETLFQRIYEKPKIGTVVESIYGLGTVISSQVYHLRTALPLVVEKIFIKEGALVKAGDPLIRFDNATLKTPIDGTVTVVNCKLGELVSAQTVAATVTNLDQLFIEVSLEQQSILRVKKGQRVSVSFESLRTEKYDGLVESVYPRDNQFIVRISLETWPDNILPGMTADVAILVGEKENVLLVPIRSIVAGEVIRRRDGKKARVNVRLGITDGDWAELLEGDILKDDEILMRKR